VDKIEWRNDAEVASATPGSTVMPQRIPSPTPGSLQGGGW
jgi:vacuolar protein sorting-associated protein 29